MRNGVRAFWMAVLSALLLAAGPACAGITPVPGPLTAVSIGRYVDFLEDPGRTLSIDDVRAGPKSRAFERSDSDVLNLGYSRSALWMRFRLGERPAHEPGWLLEVGFPSLDEVELYLPVRSADGRIVYRKLLGGDMRPWLKREFQERAHVFRLPANTAMETPIYLRVATRSVLAVPLYLWQPAGFAASRAREQLVYGLFYGLVVALFLYNLLLYASLRDRTTLWYVLYVGMFGLALFTLDGFAFEYFWPENVWWANRALGATLCGTLAFGALFARNFLALRGNLPRIDQLVITVAIAGALGTLIAVVGDSEDYSWLMRGLSLVVTVAGVTILCVAIRQLASGFRAARFFLLAWSSLVAFVMLVALHNFALAPTNFLTLYGLHIGLALDVVLLSLALADRIRVNERENQLAQRRALVHQQALLETTQANERELELRIRERTGELNRANERLREEAREREALMHQLREREEHLRFMAQHDPLTGLPNRISLQQRLELALELAKRNRKKVAVMMVDLDHFKQLNDARGHLVGDQALAAVAARLRTSVRASDSVARYGGDEFVVLASELDRVEDARMIAEKIADMVNVPLALEGGLARVSCSIGISVFPDDATESDALIEHADRAMYAAKTERGRRYAFFPGG
jgi:diguanylate cyclase (GGDEF)-like protein